jgi:hypothetical protein
MKKGLTVLHFLVTFVLFAQEKEPVYILFKQDATAECQFTVNRTTQKKIKLSYAQKRHRKINVTRFILCRNIFVFEFQKNKFEVVEKDKVANLKLITLDEILKKEEEAQYKQTINELFPNLFVIEEIENNQFSIYEVVWEKTQ